MAFFTSKTLDFWRGLARNNSKAWFDEHRKDYEKHLKEPYQALAVALCDGLRAEQPEYTLDPKKAIYRINRDTRFSNDKSPYKTELGITIGRSQKHDPDWPAYTTRLGVNGLAVAGGMYMPSTEMRDALRRHIAQEGEGLRAAIDTPAFRDLFGELGGEAHKRPLKDLKEAAEHEPLVLNKQWTFWTEHEDPEILLEDDLDELILDHWAAARPIAEWFKTALGELGYS